MAFSYNAIFNIPQRSLLERKLTKAFFLKHFDLSAGEKKILNAIANMDWMASIKPSNANIPVIKNNEYIFEEIQVIICTLGGHNLNAFGEKCAVLLQKYIPYQILLIVEDEASFIVNACNKRINLSDTSKRIIEKHITTTAISKLYKNDLSALFFESLNFGKLDKTNLETTYKSYINAIVQFQTANVTGSYNQRSLKRTEQDMKSLMEIENLEKEIVRLSNQIKKETQLNNKVALNIDIQKQRTAIETIKSQLTDSTS